MLLSVGEGVSVHVDHDYDPRKMCFYCTSLVADEERSHWRMEMQLYVSDCLLADMEVYMDSHTSLVLVCELSLLCILLFSANCRAFNGQLRRSKASRMDGILMGLNRTRSAYKQSIMQ